MALDAGKMMALDAGKMMTVLSNSNWKPLLHTKRIEVKAQASSSAAAEKRARVTAAAFFLPLAMVGCAVGLGYLIKYQNVKEAQQYYEEYLKLIDEGMDDETAKQTVLSKNKLDGPDVRKRRKRPSPQQIEDATNAASSPLDTLSIGEHNLPIQEDHPQ